MHQPSAAHTTDLKRPAKGFTLMELLISVAIIAITLSLGLPALQEMVQDYRSQQLVNRLYHLVQQSRNLAITQNTPITLCKSRDFSRCGGDWQDGILVFADRDGDLSVSGQDSVYTTVQSPYREGRLSWRSFGNKAYLQILPSGATNYQNGALTYCNDKGEVKKARGLSITVTGRPQLAIDRNGDGVRENSSGKPLRCG